MAVRKLDKNHDWTFGAGKNNYLSGSDEVAQSVKCRLWSFENDWFLNRKHGLPWFDLMGHNIDFNKIEKEIKDCVLNTDGVASVTSYNANLEAETRILSITVKYKDIYGKEGVVNYDSNNR